MSTIKKHFRFLLFILNNLAKVVVYLAIFPFLMCGCLFIMFLCTLFNVGYWLHGSPIDFTDAFDECSIVFKSIPKIFYGNWKEFK